MPGVVTTNTDVPCMQLPKVMNGMHLLVSQSIRHAGISTRFAGSRSDFFLGGKPGLIKDKRTWQCVYDVALGHI